MAQQGRSLYRNIFRNFINSFKTIKNKGEFRGKDSFGTEYYESQSQQERKLSSRWFIPVSGSFDQKLPVEWQAWLRHQRKDPPTEEEIQYNLQIMRQTLEKAKKLELPNLKDKSETTSPESNPFPTYEEYSTLPDLGNLKKK